MGFLNHLKNYDKLYFGIVLGVALPVLIYPLMKPLDRSFAVLGANYQATIRQLLPMLFTRCVFPNALLFFIFIWARFDKAARGILYATIAYTLALVGLHVYNIIVS